LVHVKDFFKKKIKKSLLSGTVTVLFLYRAPARPLAEPLPSIRQKALGKAAFADFFPNVLCRVSVYREVRGAATDLLLTMIESL
jgi:hypothetical protein